ncbi:MAG: helix-turn-helix transcriptional regulator, partial [Acidobacteria bacterium]|nr:helix-turn-helix transcriptional regulator [Acidobacteriota bacterium]
PNGGASSRAPTPRGDLTDIALGLGYSSHSHFTASFTRAFGVPPSAWQRLSRQAGDALLPQG